MTTGRSTLHKKTDFDPLFLLNDVDPFAYYQRQRHQHGNVIYCERFQGYFVLGYKEIQQLTRDDSLAADVSESIVNSTFPIKRRTEILPLITLFKSWLFYADPPYHTQLRKRLLPLFDQENVNAILSVLSDSTKTLFENLPAGKIDFMPTLANEMMIQFLVTWLGLPEQTTRTLSREMRHIEKFMMALVRTPDIFEPALQALNRFREMANELIDEHLLSPKLQTILQSVLQDHLFRKKELWMLFAFLLGAGSDTIRGMLGNTMLAFCLHPRIWTQLVGNSTLLSQAIDEALRYFPTVHMIGHVAKKTIILPQVTVQPGEYIYLCLAGANRDPAVYENPDEMSLARSPESTAAHLSFGYGFHMCLGRMMAKKIALQFFQKWFAHFPKTAFIDYQPNKVEGLVIRMPEKLLLQI